MLPDETAPSLFSIFHIDYILEIGTFLLTFLSENRNIEQNIHENGIKIGEEKGQQRKFPTKIYLKAIKQYSSQSMLALKDISSFFKFDNGKNITQTPVNHLNKQSLFTRFRIHSQNKHDQERCPDSRFSYQQINNSQSLSSKTKKRISTAGASKRFPKDFFRVSQNCHNTQNGKKHQALTIKWRVDLQEFPRNKPYIDICPKLEMQEITHSLDTPKFKNTQFMEPSLENQFIRDHQAKAISAFPHITELQLETKEKAVKRPNFIKKVKKGEILKHKIESTRCINLSEQSGKAIISIGTIH